MPDAGPVEAAKARSAQVLAGAGFLEELPEPESPEELLVPEDDSEEEPVEEPEEESELPEPFEEELSEPEPFDPEDFELPAPELLFPRASFL